MIISAVAAVVLVGCSTTSEPEITGVPDTLWEQVKVVKPDKPWVVGVGDSFMSGEGGRWASNGSDNATLKFVGGWLVGTVDQVYGDGVNYTESIPGCHRTATAPMFTGADVNHANLACSGAQTNSMVNKYGNAKPGIDFETITSGAGQQVQGQATQLQEFAAKHDVEVVTMSIGGNDMGFPEMVLACVSNWIIGAPCKNSDLIASRVNPAVQEIVTKRVTGSIENINTAMTRAGKAPGTWRLLIQLPPSPVPGSGQMEYQDFAFNRQAYGGCGMLDVDLDFANDTLLPYLDSIITDAVGVARKDPKNAPMTIVDMEKALYGHRLCEKGTTRPPGGTGIPPDGFGQNVEWVRFISVIAAATDSVPFDTEEGMHPTYFGQRALASCMTLAVETNAATPRVGCSLSSPLSFGEQALPQMVLQPE